MGAVFALQCAVGAQLDRLDNIQKSTQGSKRAYEVITPDQMKSLENEILGYRLPDELIANFAGLVKQTKDLWNEFKKNYIDCEKSQWLPSKEKEDADLDFLTKHLYNFYQRIQSHMDQNIPSADMGRLGFAAISAMMLSVCIYFANITCTHC